LFEDEFLPFPLLIESLNIITEGVKEHGKLRMYYTPDKTKKKYYKSMQLKVSKMLNDITKKNISNEKNRTSV